MHVKEDKGIKINKTDILVFLGTLRNSVLKDKEHLIKSNKTILG